MSLARPDPSFLDWLAWVGWSAGATVIVWPSLSPDASHRLTWSICAGGLGLLACQRPARALPRGWVALGLAAVATMLWHHREVLLDGNYVVGFKETAWLADGALVIAAALWGMWALWQWPLKSLRRLRWIGAGLVLGNLVIAWGQLADWSPGLRSIPGAMGLDRFLGALGVLWAPILWHWSPWLGSAAILLVALSGKLSAFIGLSVAWLAFHPGWTWKARLLLLSAVGLAGWLLWVGQWDVQLRQRELTWWHTAHASLRHPWLGAGWGPTSKHAIEAYGYTLPAIHSDWLALAFHGGWPLTCASLSRLWACLARPASTPWGGALRASLLGVLVMSAGQSLLGHARILSSVILVLLWYLQEEEAHEVPVASRQSPALARLVNAGLVAGGVD